MSDAKVYIDAERRGKLDAFSGSVHLRTEAVEDSHLYTYQPRPQTPCILYEERTVDGRTLESGNEGVYVLHCPMRPLLLFLPIGIS